MVIRFKLADFGLPVLSTYFTQAVVLLQFVEVSGLPQYHADCSNTGKRCLTCGPIVLDKLEDNQTVTARFELQVSVTMCCVQLYALIRRQTRIP